MEVQQVSKEIYEYIEILRKNRLKLKEVGRRKSQAISDYYKMRALIMMKLKNGIELELNGEKIKNPPATIIPEIARGMCHKEKLERELSESEYKSLIVKIESLKAELNALQSVNRYLDVGAK